jgi:DNA-directed RNA polymerase I subunit RPA43
MHTSGRTTFPASTDEILNFQSQIQKTRMSIEESIPSAMPTMGSEKQKNKSDKKHKSSQTEKERRREKKRKRDQAGEESNSKKHKSTAAAPESIPDPESDEKPAQEISPFHIQTSSLYLPLAAVSQKFPLEGICAEHISPLMLTYYPPFEGVLLSYSNPRLSEKPFGNDGKTTLMKSIDEYAVSWTWVTAEFLLFKPEKGAWLEGFVNLQNEGHLGLVCWNLFNASIQRNRLPKDWKWVGVESELVGEGEDEVYAENGLGYYVDDKGNKVEGNVRFRIRDTESSHDRERGFLSIAGTMLSERKETELTQSENDINGGRANAGRLLGGLKGLGATSLGVPFDPDQGDGTGVKKQRTRY